MLTSVRQAAQRNTGRKTAGIDGEVALTSPWRASNIPDSGPYKVRSEMEDGECRNRAGVSLLSSRIKR